MFISIFQHNPLTSQESLLFVSTLDGSLHAVSKATGRIQWSLKGGNPILIHEIDVCMLLVTPRQVNVFKK